MTTTNRFRSIVSACMTLTLAAHAEEQPAGDAEAQANNPLAEFTAFNLHNYYIGEFTGLNDDANQFIMRFAKPFSIGESDWVMRASLPVNTYPTSLAGDHKTGLGDLNIQGFYLFDTGNPALSVGLGPQLTIPTATDDALGSEQWSAGFSHILFNASSKVIQYGYLLTWQASFAGSDSRRDVNSAAFQPFVFLQLGEGWYLRSSAVVVYDFDSDDYTVPLGLGFGKVIATESTVFNLFIEPQYSIWDRGGGWPEWQVFVGLNMQFK